MYLAAKLIKKKAMKKVTLKTIEQNDNVSLYSICFNGNDISEYEKLDTVGLGSFGRVRLCKNKNTNI